MNRKELTLVSYSFKNEEYVSIGLSGGNNDTPNWKEYFKQIFEVINLSPKVYVTKIENNMFDDVFYAYLNVYDRNVAQAIINKYSIPIKNTK